MRLGILNPIRANFLIKPAVLCPTHVRPPLFLRRYTLKHDTDDSRSRSDDPSSKSPPPHVVYVPSSNGISDATLTAVIGLGMVFVGGIAYFAWYKKRVLDKIENAFAPGYDPALELATHASPVPSMELDPHSDDELWTQHLCRREQEIINRIVHGKEHGHYWLFLGPKGTGKTTMIFDAMKAINAEGIAMCEAHPDVEVFRLRLGKALNFEYQEDSQMGLFQRRDPREGGPALDIERALNKLEKVALRSARKTGRPLVLIINNIHHLKNDDEGRSLLLQLQQRAESWAASGILTFVFGSDSFWPFQVLRRSASRMHIMTISDLTHREATQALARIHVIVKQSEPKPTALQRVISLVGGRMSYLNKATRSGDMVKMAEHMKDVEKGWLLSQIGLIPDCDDDVMDEQKWSSSSWLLLREFVKIRVEQEKDCKSDDEIDQLPLPAIPYWRCRQIMTRADFLEELDRLNVIAIDVNHDVRPDSMLVFNAIREVVEEDGFDDVLENVCDRVSEIESLLRTRELTFKDMKNGDRVKFSLLKI